MPAMHRASGSPHAIKDFGAQLVRHRGDDRESQHFPSVDASSLDACARTRRGTAGNERPWPADKVERWGIDRLIPYANNARTHTDAQGSTRATAAQPRPELQKSEQTGT